MVARRITLFGSLVFLLMFTCLLAAAPLSVEGAPTDVGFPRGALATIRATVKGIQGNPAGYAVFAKIQYVGTTAEVDVQMNRAGETQYEVGWPIPKDAPTGVYSVLIRVEDRRSRKEVASQKLPGFVVHHKPLRITRVELDKTFYYAGDPVRCAVTVENTGDQPLKDLRVEFSHAYYPAIAAFTGEAQDSPDLAIRLLGEHLDVPARSSLTLPLQTAGEATFLQGAEVALVSAGGPARHTTAPPPEVVTYAVAVWNADRSVLYDLHFARPAVVRGVGREEPIPYGRWFPNPYLSEVDLTKYRSFYPPGQISPALELNPGRTLYRPGETVRLNLVLKNTTSRAWQGAQLRAEISAAEGKLIRSFAVTPPLELAPGKNRQEQVEVWSIPPSQPPGNHGVKLSLVDSGGVVLASTVVEIAVNEVPGALLYFGPHEDDEIDFAGLIQAGLEAGASVRAVVFAAGDVGACEVYYLKPCGPNEAREFGLVRMGESRHGFAHLGLAPHQVDFLGLPDAGLASIWSHANPANPYLSPNLGTDRAPYENVLKPNLVFARDTVLEVVKQIIAEFRPAMIAVSHPDERHADHRGASFFVLKACQELLREGRIDPNTIILTNVAYGQGVSKPAPYRYEKHTVHLSGEAAAKKQEMQWLYQSQQSLFPDRQRRTWSELPREESFMPSWTGRIMAAGMSSNRDTVLYRRRTLKVGDRTDCFAAPARTTFLFARHRGAP